MLRAAGFSEKEREREREREGEREREREREMTSTNPCSAHWLLRRLVRVLHSPTISIPRRRAGAPFLRPCEVL